MLDVHVFLSSEIGAGGSVGDVLDANLAQHEADAVEAREIWIGTERCSRISPPPPIDSPGVEILVSDASGSRTTFVPLLVAAVGRVIATSGDVVTGEIVGSVVGNKRTVLRFGES